MSGIPEDDLEETRAALAPTLEATAAILPWLAKPRPQRFPKKLNERWLEAGARLASAWSPRHPQGTGDLRPAIFALYGIALETADADCLRFGEALASAADALEGTSAAPRLIAALSASIECLAEAEGLEHIRIGERLRHFAQRLENSVACSPSANERSPVLDRLFVSEASERLERMHEALSTLPPDAYALKLEAAELGNQAEQLELYGILHIAREIEPLISTGDRGADLDSPATRTAILAILHRLAAAILAVTN